MQRRAIAELLAQIDSRPHEPLDVPGGIIEVHGAGLGHGTEFIVRLSVDIGLPGMNGYELGRRLRDAHRHLYLVALTGDGRHDDRKAAHAAGFDRRATGGP